MKIFPHWRWFKGGIVQSSHRIWMASLITSSACVLLALTFLVLAGNYLEKNYAHLPPLPDLGHKAFPVVDLRLLMNVGLVISLVLFAIGFFREPNRIPYVMFVVSFWFVIRVASMTVTPLGVPEGYLPSDTPVPEVKNIWDFIQQGLGARNTLFFSGHAGLPFLGFLLFKRNLYASYLIWPLALITAVYISHQKEYPTWIVGALTVAWISVIIFRNHHVSLNKIFLIWSFLMAVTVLLTRNHYSIDILGAYFMTGGTFLIGRAIFHKLEDLCESLELDLDPDDEEKSS